MRNFKILKVRTTFKSLTVEEYTFGRILVNVNRTVVVGLVGADLFYELSSTRNSQT